MAKKEQTSFWWDFWWDGYMKFTWAMIALAVIPAVVGFIVFWPRNI